MKYQQGHNEGEFHFVIFWPLFSFDRLQCDSLFSSIFYIVIIQLVI